MFEVTVIKPYIPALSLAEAVALRSPAVNLTAWEIAKEAERAAQNSLNADRADYRVRAPLQTGPVCDCPPWRPSARVFTPGELEAARWLEGRTAYRVKPARRSSRLARLAQRLN